MRKAVFTLKCSTNIAVCHPPKIWIFLTNTPLRIAWNSPNWKSLANMRVLRWVAHSADYQMVANFTSQKELFLTSKNSVFGQFCETICGFCAVICIESKWVCRHIKVSYDLEQNVTNAKTQFDLAVNPLWFNINLKTRAQACRNGRCVLVPECHFQKGLFFMNYFDKTCCLWILAKAYSLRRRMEKKDWNEPTRLL